MKRKELLRQLQAGGCELRREGARHSVFYNPHNGKTSTVPRHAEIKDRLAAKILQDLGISGN